jgi:DNA (cytosine-5)-methyltransferase 1
MSERCHTLDLFPTTAAWATRGASIRDVVTPTRSSSGLRCVDLFAGAGGSSTGLAQAGCEIVYAANHARDAVAVHELNHPDTEHVCQDLHLANFHHLPDYDLLWASPSCKGHSEAASGGGRYSRRGIAPGHDQLRATAWAAVTAAEVGRPHWVVIENVEAMQGWELYQPWLDSWARLGYSLSSTTINAADCGVPQDRPRLFVVGVLGTTPFELERPTGYRARTMREVANLKAGRWARVGDHRSRNVQLRVRRAIERNRFEGAFHTQNVSDNSGRSLDRPHPTITTKSPSQCAWIRGSGRWQDREYRLITRDETAALMGFPADYDWGSTPKTRAGEMLGNAVAPPVAAEIAKQILRRG